MNGPSLAAAALAALATPTAIPQEDAEAAGRPVHSSFEHEDVLGTSCRIRVLGAEAEAAGQERAIMAAIERLDGILSCYDPASELRRLVPGRATQVSADLAAVLAACERWRAATDGAFDASIGPLDELWRAAASSERRPTDDEVAAALARIADGRWSVDGARVTPTAVGQRPDGLAKGYVIDAAAAAGLAAGADAVFLDVGGDMVARHEAVRVAIHDPRRSGDNRAPLTTIQLADAAVATSGNYARGYVIGDAVLGHVVDPRTGCPVERVLQASVVAPLAVDADALATALMVLDPVEGVALVDSLVATECLVVDAAGHLHPSRGWAALEDGRPGTVEASATRPAWPADRQVSVAFEFERPERARGRRPKPYRRPYVAVWVEDEAGEPVRTLCLWIQRERWLRDLRRWHRYHGSDRELIDAVTRATRNPGRYDLVWDGCDDAGRVLPLGRYTVFIEAAREHGSYQVTSGAIDTREARAVVDLEANVEIESARLSFGVDSGLDGGTGAATDAR